MGLLEISAVYFSMHLCPNHSSSEKVKELCIFYFINGQFTYKYPSLYEYEAHEEMHCADYPYLSLCNFYSELLPFVLIKNPNKMMCIILDLYQIIRTNLFTLDEIYSSQLCTHALSFHYKKIASTLVHIEISYTTIGEFVYRNGGFRLSNMHAKEIVNIRKHKLLSSGPCAYHRSPPSHILVNFTAARENRK